MQDQFDIFICHASEDKEKFVRQLVKELQKKKLRVWYDEFELKLGDSLRECIDKGLASSRYGAVVLSHAFYSKDWPQQELNALYAKFTLTGDKVILPVWHGITTEEVQKYSPLLADRVAAKSSDGVETVANQIFEVISGNKTEPSKANKGNKPENSDRVQLIRDSLGRFFKKEWKWIVGTVLVVIGLIITLGLAQNNGPFINIKPFQYTKSHEYFFIKKNPKEGDFVVQFQLEVHNVRGNVAKDLTFLKSEVRLPSGQSKSPSIPIISSDLGPYDKFYAKFNLVTDTLTVKFKRLPSGDMEGVPVIPMIEFDVILKYSSDMFFFFKKEHQIDASYKISADSAVRTRYETF